MTEHRHGHIIFHDDVPPVVGNHRNDRTADRFLLYRHLKERGKPFGDAVVMFIFWATLIALLFIPAFLLG